MGKYLSNLTDPEKTRVDMRDCTGHAIALSHAIELRKDHGPRPPVQDDHFVSGDNMLDLESLERRMLTHIQVIVIAYNLT